MTSDISLSFDILLQYGNIRNLDVSSRGIYFLKTSLSTVNRHEYLHHLRSHSMNQLHMNKNPPKGCYSAASNFDCSIGYTNTTLYNPFPIENSSIDEIDNSYKTRTFLIRYRDEIHELNEGTSWKIQSKLSNHDESLDIALITIELYHTKFTSNSDMNVITDIEKLLPINPSYRCVCTQTIVIPNLMHKEGIHEYYPISFTKGFLFHLDCIIHCNLTTILPKFQLDSLTINFPIILNDESYRNEVSYETTSDLTETTVISHSQHGSLFVATSIPYNEDDSSSNNNTKSSPNRVNGIKPHLKKFSPVKSPQQSADQMNTPSISSNKTGIKPLKMVSSFSALPSSFQSNISTLTMSSSFSLFDTENTTNTTPSETQSRGQSQAHSSVISSTANDLLSHNSSFLHNEILTVGDGGIRPHINDQNQINAISQYCHQNLRLFVLNYSILYNNYKHFNSIKQNYLVGPETLDSVEIDEILSVGAWDLFRSSNPANATGQTDLASFESIDMLVDKIIHSCERLDDMMMLLELWMEQYNIVYANIWNRIVSIARKILQSLKSWNDVDENELVRRSGTVGVGLCELLRQQYNITARKFWTQQMILHQCSVDYMQQSHPNEDKMMSDLTNRVHNEHIAMTQTCTIPLARGLALFDLNSQQNLENLPTMVLQRYSIDSDGQNTYNYADYTSMSSIISREIDNDPESKTHSTNTLSSSHSLDGLLNSNVDKSNNQDDHLVVLVHGFQGSHQDMRLLASMLLMIYPRIKVLCSSANDECKEEDSIADMADRLADEVFTHCDENFPDLLSSTNFGKISFIGHSIGGIVVRKALENPLLVDLLPKLHLFLSLASPHMGTLHPSSQIISTGMWALDVIIKRNKCRVLKELQLEDSATLESTMLYQCSLRSKDIMPYFRKIVVVSSLKDQYVPSYSARIQVVPISTGSKSTSRIDTLIIEMMNSILSQVDHHKLFRLILDNNINLSPNASSSQSTGVTSILGTINLNIDTLIGRSAHICYLDNPVVVMQLINVLAPFFQ